MSQGRVSVRSGSSAQGKSGKRRQRRLASAVGVVVDALERRQMLTAVINGSGNLQVDGTTGADTIALAEAAGQITVTVNAVVEGTFDMLTFTGIQVNGLDGDDVISLAGVSRGANVDAGDGADSVVGGDGADTVAGGIGNDTIAGNNGTDLITGGDGDDAISGSAGNDTIDGGIGNDAIAGGDDNDQLTGGAGLDTITGGLGNDAIDGTDGDDSLAGGAGNDTITGGIGNDSIDGTDGDDSLGGGDGLDTILGGLGDDSVDGGLADDSIGGGDGLDTLLGGVGNDAIDGGDGADSIDGGDGGDTLTGGLGGDTLLGGIGDDSFITNDGVADTLDGGLGTDSATADNLLDTFTSIESGIPIPAPVVGVTLGGNPVADGATTPIDFGSVNLNAAGPTRSFVVTNSGTAALVLGTLTVPAGFQIVDDLAATLAPGASDTITIRLVTTAAGTFGGDLSFANTDPAHNPFNFAITGTVVTPPAPIIVVTQARPSGNIDDGNSTVEFGNKAVGTTGPTRTFRVRNDGVGVLNLGTVVAPAGFTIIDPLIGPLAPGASESFVVQVDTGVVGTKDGFVTFTTNDPLRGDFTFRVQANVLAEAVPTPEVTLKSVQAKGNLRGVLSGVSAFAFGTAEIGSARPTRTFRVSNDGDATLNLGKVVVPAGFVILDNLPAQMKSGAIDYLIIGLDTAAVGNRSGFVTFATNDGDENPFTFGVSGSVIKTPAGEGSVATAALANGVLTVNGTSGIDTIQVGQSSKGISVVANSKALNATPFKGVTKITINAGDGDDRVILGSGVTVGASVVGGNGNDTIVGGDGNDALYGNAGNDSIDGGLGKDGIWGGAGNDTLTGGLGVDAIYGEDGNDVIFGADGLSELLDGGNGSDVIHKDRTDNAVNA